MTTQDLFGLVATLYCVANLGSMGLELDLPAALRSLRSARLVALALGWSWVAGPALGVLLTKVLPLSEGHATGLILFSLAPTAPALPMFIRKARADMAVAAALMPLAVVGTVVLMPLLAPWLIQGLEVDAWALARPLLLTVLLPLLFGVALRAYAPRAADGLFPWFKRAAGLSTLALLLFTVVVYGREFIGAVGSFAPGAQILFTLGLALPAYVLAFGLPRAERSAVALGVCTRNGGAMFVAYTGLPNPDPQTLVMILLAVPIPIIVWMVLARLFASWAGAGPAAGSGPAPTSA